jgi:hypothetical protein
MAEVKASPAPGWNFDNSYARLPRFFYRSLYPTPVRGRSW